ncbi:hypothetical protein [Streptomyces sp. NPDC051183]|uniref:hypothetical protein n=1 Tax=Streptomyces sp. NPDC051183 TaxID=3155165 RepID=UPI0034346CEC
MDVDVFDDISGTFLVLVLGDRRPICSNGNQVFTGSRAASRHHMQPSIHQVAWRVCLFIHGSSVQGIRGTETVAVRFFGRNAT